MQNKYRNITISYVPVRTFEGKAVKQFYSFPHLIGVFDKKTYKRISKFYEVCGCKTILVMPPEKAELTKLFSNVFRQTEMAIANELGRVSELYGFDPKDVVKLVNEGDPYRYLKIPGLWGGFCLPKDTRMLIKALENKHGYTPKISKISEEIREETIRRKTQEILSLGENLSVGIEGVTSKPIEVKTPDIRGSPILEIIRLLVRNSVNVKIFDPNLSKEELEEIAKDLGVQVATAQEVQNCDVYARYENYDLCIKKVKTNK